MKLISWISFLFAASTFAADTEKACFSVQGMTCSACSVTLKAAVLKIDGIVSVSSSAKEGSAAVEFQKSKTNAEAIRSQIDSTGYKASIKECPKG